MLSKSRLAVGDNASLAANCNAGASPFPGPATSEAGSKPRHHEPQVCIILLNWNGKHLLDECLESLRRTTDYANLSVVLVDNNSSDGSIDLVKQKHGWVDVLELHRNYGFAIGNNRGIRYAIRRYDPSYFLLLNNDVVAVQRDWLKRMVEVCESKKDVGVVGCRLIYPNGVTQHVGTSFAGGGPCWIDPVEFASCDGVIEVDAVLGACMLMKRHILEVVGLLDAKFSPFQHEESDLCARVTKAGYRVLLDLGTRLVHKQGASLIRIDSCYLRYVNERNLRRFLLLNYSGSMLLQRIPHESVDLLRCFLRRDKKKNRPFPFDLVLAPNPELNSRVYLESWAFNIRDLSEIIQKRRVRNQKPRKPIA